MAELSPGKRLMKAGRNRRVTVSSPVLFRQQVRHFVAYNVGSAVLTVGCLVWTAVMGVHFSTILIAVAFYFLTVAGVEIGFHRCLAHGAFTAPRWLRATLAICGVMAAQGPAAYWIANHRRHHIYSDREGDPHSPSQGLWHAHVGWLLDREVTLTTSFAPDMLKDPTLRWIDRRYHAIVIAGLITPGVLAFAARPTLETFVSGVLWGGGLRMFLVQHGAYFINSGCHHLGRRSFVTADLATNFAPMVWPSLGQSLHNNHHAFPNSATTAFLKGDVDPGWLVVLALSRFGAVTDIQLPGREALVSKLVSKADAARLKPLAPT